jgi:hypothetical protein
MPGKSKHGKKRHLHQSRKSRAKQRYGTAALSQQGVAETPQPVAAVSKPPSSGVPASSIKSRTASYSDVAAELRVIGILAGIIIVILIVLAQILS